MRRSLATLLFVLLFASAAHGRSAAGGSPFAGRLARAVFDGDLAVLDLDAGTLPETVRPRFALFLARYRGFRSHLADPGRLSEGPERWQLEKRQRVERGIVAVIARDGIEASAAEYATQAVIQYEWEGMSDGPLAEAAFAETYLEQHPGTALRPYLNLFIINRLRYTEVFLTSEKNSTAAAAASARLQQCRAAAAGDPDPLIGWVAADIEVVPVRDAVRPTGGEVTATPCGERRAGQIVRDPAVWVAECFMGGEKPCEGPDALRRFELDLDGDGTPEIFVACPAEMGNAGGPHYVFRRRGQMAEFLGELFLHPKAIRVLPGGAEGPPRLLRYVRKGPGEGTLDTLVYQGGQFRVIHSEVVSPLGKDEQRLKELFGWP
jgi:hypothetical protein